MTLDLISPFYDGRVGLLLPVFKFQQDIEELFDGDMTEYWLHFVKVFKWHRLTIIF